MQRNKSRYTIYDLRYTGAYTLIELLVVISISLIVFTFGLAGYRDFSRRQAISGIAKQVKGDLRLAQQLALTGQKPTLLCTKLTGYTFSVSSSTSYQLTANCINANRLVKDVTLPTGLSLTLGSVKFKVLGQGTDLSSPLTFTVSGTATSTTENIVVGIAGDVK